MSHGLEVTHSGPCSRAGNSFQDNFRFIEARNFVSVPPVMEVSHSVATGQAPLSEAGTSQGLTTSPMDYISMQNSISQPPLDISTLHYPHNLPVTEHGGLGDVRVLGHGEQELHSEIPEAYTTSKYEYEQSAGTPFLGNDRRGKVLTYPDGGADAVTITERDMEGLRPTEYLGNNIIDFCIRYLERKLSPEDRERLHFFNSFFFTKLLESNSASYNVDQCKVDFEHVRRWSREVNLFEKDYIFIPVIRSSHWSLIIICHLRNLWSASDEKKGSPCILHLDPVLGKHESFKRLVRSYISKAWMEKHPGASDNMDQLFDLFQMKYIQAEVPRQDNGYDCGLYLLHYIEVFLLEATSQSYSPAPRKGVPLFSSPHFAQDISVKRVAIWNLILGLKDAQSNTVPMFDAQRHVSKHPSIGTETHQTDNRTSWELTMNTNAQNGDAVGHEECPLIVEVPMDKNQQVRNRPGAALPEPSKVCKKRIWTDEETRTLLKCKAEGRRFCRKNQTGMNWDSVSREISNTLGTTPSAEQCRRRYETLQKAYKSMKDYSLKTGRTFSEVTEVERVGLKLATTLIEEWYECIDAFAHKVKPQKRARHSGGDDTGQVSAGDVNHAAPVRSAVPDPAAWTSPISVPAPIPTGNSSRNRVGIPGFKSLEEDLRSTLLDLVMLLRFEDYILSYDLEEACRNVGIVQDRKPSVIRKHVFQLSELKLVKVDHLFDAPWLKVWELRVYKKFVEKVFRKNPDFDIYLKVMRNDGIVSFSGASVPLSVHRIRVLVLSGCGNLQRVDLSFFPELRYLHIGYCHKLEKVTGWEAVKELGYLEIDACGSYKDFPPIHWLPSFREFRDSGSWIEVDSVADFSQCVRLRRLGISKIETSALNIMDLSTLRFLEVLTFRYCDALTSIQGLSALHYLTTLKLEVCRALRRVPELGCLKALTKLEMGWSGVEEISGVQELHSLTSLDLRECRSLKTLPCLSHLKALTMLDISWSGVEEIQGVQDLISLEKLLCYGSRLKWLPDLHHLPRLQSVWIENTPLSTTESPSSIYYGKKRLQYNCERKRKDFDDDISDVSDTNDISDVSDTDDISDVSDTDI